LGSAYQLSKLEWKGGLDSSHVYPAICLSRSKSRAGGSTTSSGTAAELSMAARREWLGLLRGQRPSQRVKVASLC